MEKRDRRGLSPDAQYELRKRVVRLREKGMSNKEISEVLDLWPSYVSNIWQIYQRGGPLALKAKARGRRQGERNLTSGQEADLMKILVDQSPHQRGYEFYLWTREAVSEVIKQVSGFEMPLRTVSDYMKRWGLMACKPTEQVDERNEKGLSRWLTSDYRDILTRSKRENAEIHWCDVTGVNADGVAMVSTVTTQGKVRFMLYCGTLSNQIMRTFLSRLTLDRLPIGRLTKYSKKQKIILITSDHKVYQSVDTWLCTLIRERQIELIYLPLVLPKHDPAATAAER